MHVNNVSLPDFRNWGVALRILLLAMLARLITQYAYAPESGIHAVLPDPHGGLLFEIVLLMSAAMLAAASPWLRRHRYLTGVALSILLVAACAGASHALFAWLMPHIPVTSPFKAALLAATLTSVILLYFNWRSRSLFPAAHEHRLALLQARIRPHFLFNGLNTAIATVRHDSRLAERILLDLSDLFRQALRRTDELVPLKEEVQITQAYLDIETMRLGERLRVEWDVEESTLATPVPTLFLQPLVENAVRHGIEPRDHGGTICIHTRLQRQMLLVEITNTAPPTHAERTTGNQIALNTTAERLALLFDEEAQLTTRRGEDYFSVSVSLPANGRLAYLSQHSA